ncbi:MAG TPA: bifunctional phosphoglucose/phosphomannose isomerase [Candidatus Thermoplasmatota archaeon]|nr:bifunctional phosphoglucose/phosphomannose isomerase [Candidatus Thermoplasmatota archaeon]
MNDGSVGSSLTGFPDQVRDAIAIGRAFAPRATRPVSRVVVCGMGGSGIGGALVAAWASREGGRTPIVLHHDYGLPSFVDDSTLVVALSYSGDTEETLTAFELAGSRGAARLAVTTGGKLAARAQAASVDVVALPKGFQPRAAAGYLTIPLAFALSKWGAVPDPGASCKAALAAVAELAPALTPDAPADKNEARAIAQALVGRIAVCYGLGPYAIAARRFANELSENGKVLAFHGAIPEICHNDLVGWSGDDASRVALAIVTGPEAGRANEERARFMETVARERGAAVARLAASGGDFLANLFSVVYLGDWTSYYLARLRNVDPTPVEVIGRLKSELSRLGTIESWKP